MILDKPHVFISYAREDGREYADYLYKAFLERGIAAWRDERSINPYQDFSSSIEKAIEKSSYVIVCLTPSAIRDDSFVRRELIHALNWKKPIIPILLPGFDKRRVPIIINHLTWIEIKAIEQDLSILFERLGKEIVFEIPTISILDPFYDYLQTINQYLIDFLDRSIISKEVLNLQGTDTPQAIQTQTIPFFFETSLPPWAAKQDSMTEFDNLIEAFNYHKKRILLLGEPGSGKTTTLLAFARDKMYERFENPNSPLPIYAAISKWDFSLHLIDWLTKSIPNHDSSQLQKTIENGNAILILDGLDELGSSRISYDPETGNELERFDPRKLFLSAVERLPSTVGFVISCRSRDYFAIGEKLSHGGAITLKPMTDKQVDEYLANYPTLRTIIRQDPQLYDMAHTPLLLTLLVYTYSNTTNELNQLHSLAPEELIPEILKSFVETCYRYEISHKPNNNEIYDLGQIYDIIGNAIVITLNGENNEDYNEVRIETFEQVLGDDPTEFLGLICNSYILLNTGAGIFRLPHSMIRNHFVLKYCETYSGKEFDKIQTALKRISESIPKQEFGESVIDTKIIDLYKEFTRKVSSSEVISDGEKPLNALLTNLQNLSAEIRFQSAFELRQIKDPLVVEALIDVLNDKDQRVRFQAIRTLGEIGDPRAVEPLVNVMYTAEQPEDASIHSIPTQAAFALADIGEQAVPALINALREGSEQVQVLAATALADIGDGAVEPLIAALQKANPLVRQKIVWVLWSIGDPRAVQPMKEALHDSDSKTRRYAAWALGQIGDPSAIPELIAALDDTHEKVRWDAAVALEKLGKATVEPLIIALQTGNERTRIGAANALAWLKDSKALNPLINALGDLNPHVRGRAAFALGWMREQKAIKPLIALLNDSDEEVRLQAIAALGWLRDDSAIDPLVELIQTKGEWLPYAATEALGEIGNERAIKPLLDALNSLNPRVREAAREALKKLGYDPDDFDSNPKKDILH